MDTTYQLEQTVIFSELEGLGNSKCRQKMSPVILDFHCRTTGKGRIRMERAQALRDTDTWQHASDHLIDGSRTEI